MSIVMIHVGSEQVIGDLAVVDRLSITILPMTLWISPILELSPVGRQRRPAVQFYQPALWTTASAFDVRLISEWKKAMGFGTVLAFCRMFAPHLVGIRCLRWTVWRTFQDPDRLSVISFGCVRFCGCRLSSSSVFSHALRLLFMTPWSFGKGRSTLWCIFSLER